MIRAASRSCPSTSPRQGNQAVAHRDDVVPVATDLDADRGGQVARRHVQPRKLGDGVGQQVALQLVADPPLALVARARLTTELTCVASCSARPRSRSQKRRPDPAETSVTVPITPSPPLPSGTVMYEVNPSCLMIS